MNQPLFFIELFFSDHAMYMMLMLSLCSPFADLCYAYAAYAMIAVPVEVC